MMNDSHFPTLEGTLTVLKANGEVKEQRTINKSTGKGIITAQIHDANGNLTSEEKIPFKSFVSNMAKMLLASFEEITSANTTVLLTDTAAATDYASDADVNAAANDATYGIVVGLNDSTAGYLPSMGTRTNLNNYALRHQVAEGTSAGQITHGACLLAYTNGNSGFTIARTFTNSSGGTILVKELGVVGFDGSKNYLVARDTETSVVFPYETTGAQTAISLSVSTASTLTITYSFSIDDTDGLLNGFLGVVASTLSGGAQTIGTCQINTSVSTASIDLVSNPTYKSWLATSGVEDIGLLVGDGLTATSRSAYSLLNIDQTLTHAEQTAGTISYPTPNGYDTVINTIGTWSVYKIYIGATRTFTNATGSMIGLYEGAIVLAGSASSARIPIVRFLFPGGLLKINDTESLLMDLKISMISTVQPGVS